MEQETLDALVLGAAVGIPTIITFGPALISKYKSNKAKTHKENKVVGSFIQGYDDIVTKDGQRMSRYNKIQDSDLEKIED